MPFYRVAKAHVNHSTVDNDWWRSFKSDVVCTGGRCFVDGRRLRTAERMITGYHPQEWLLSHVSIMASVDTMPGPGGATYPDFWITPETQQFVNNNGDAWEKKLLLASFRSFIGAENYTEHVQHPALSKGKVIDAVSREVPVLHPVTKEPLIYADGRPVTTVYIDILVATQRRFEELCEMVTRGQVNAMSMGCLLKFTICSECGKTMYRDADSCTHIKFNKGGTHTDIEGRTRRTAELCGHVTDPTSCEFVEASWVSVPAFRGALARKVLQIDQRRFAARMRTAERAAKERFDSIYTKAAAASVGKRLQVMNQRVLPARVAELVRWMEDDHAG